MSHSRRVVTPSTHKGRYDAGSRVTSEPVVTLPRRMIPALPVRLTAPPTSRRDRRTTHSLLRDRMLRPGWPLAWLLVGLPLWWVLGLGTLMFVVVAVPMLVQLRRCPHIELPPGFWLWGLFLVWQVLGLIVLGVDPPGTHGGSLSGRALAVTFLIIEYAAVTVVLLYVGNVARRTVSQADIGRWMGVAFLSVLAGGVLGTIAPTFAFRSVLEYALPHSITANQFTRSIVHPVAAQVQDVIGAGNGRPAAPFGYTNTWGNAISILLVWFFAAWVVPARGGRRVAYALIVAATAVPVVYSLNRGLWIGIGLTVVWVVARQLRRGRLGLALAVTSAVGAAAVALAASPLADVIRARLTHGVSDNIRQFVANLSLVAARHSPVVGYGANRHADGSVASIAVGPSVSCQTCGSVATGSTGQLWSVLFDNGVLGTLLYFGFFAFTMWRYWRYRDAISEAALVTVALGFVYMLFYSALPVAPVLTMVAVGVLWRGEHVALSRDDLAPRQDAALQ